MIGQSNTINILENIWSLYFPLDEEDFDPSSPKAHVVLLLNKYFHNEDLAKGGKQFLRDVDWSTEYSVHVDYSLLIRTCICVARLSEGLSHQPER